MKKTSKRISKIETTRSQRECSRLFVNSNLRVSRRNHIVLRTESIVLECYQRTCFVNRVIPMACRREGGENSKSARGSETMFWFIEWRIRLDWNVSTQPVGIEGWDLGLIAWARHQPITWSQFLLHFLAAAPKKLRGDVYANGIERAPSLMDPTI